MDRAVLVTARRLRRSLAIPLAVLTPWEIRNGARASGLR